MTAAGRSKRHHLATCHRPLRAKIVNALAEAADDAAKPQPDRHEIGTALERVLGYAGKAADFGDKADKIATHVQNAVAWLGENWHKLLPVVGLAL